MASTIRERNNRWVKQVEKAFYQPLSDTPYPEASIYQVPPNIRSVKPDAYTPHTISMGPYHHLRLRTPDPYKMELVKSFLTPSQIQQFQALLIDELMNFTPTIRNCYKSYLDIVDEQLVWIFAIDSLFLLQFLKSCEYMDKENEGIVRDIMLLENQIPIILLKKIWTILDSGPEAELISMLTRMCKKVSPLKLIDESLYLTCAPGDRMHLLDMMYQLIVENRQQNQITKASSNKVPPFSQLSRMTKLKFLPREGIRDVNFNHEKLTLYLPTLTLNVNSEVILKNLVAYETSSEKPSLEMCGYVYLMNGIVDTFKNVKMLRDAGIIVGGSDYEIAKIFNGYGRGAIQS